MSLLLFVDGTPYFFPCSIMVCFLLFLSRMGEGEVVGWVTHLADVCG